MLSKVDKAYVEYLIKVFDMDVNDIIVAFEDYYDKKIGEELKVFEVEIKPRGLFSEISDVKMKMNQDYISWEELKAKASMKNLKVNDGKIVIELKLLEDL